MTIRQWPLPPIDWETLRIDGLIVEPRLGTIHEEMRVYQMCTEIGWLCLGGFWISASRHGIKIHWGSIRESTDGDAYLCQFELSRKTTEEEWRSLKLFFAWLGQAPISGSQQWARTTFKAIRASVLHEPKEWWDVLAPEIVGWAHKQLERLTDGLDYVDNTRVAQLRNTAQMRRYKRQKDAGCCGFVDEIERAPDGKLYLLGANFGH